MSDTDESQASAGSTSCTVFYPEHQPPPREDILDFISLPAFDKRWKKLGLNQEEDLQALKISIMANPKGAPIIRGTGGIRKARFSSDSWPTGLSGGVRVLYKSFDDYNILLLCLVYAKNEQDNISDSVKQELHKIVREVEKELARKGSL